MTLNHAHKRLLLNVPSNERRFLAKVLREQMRIIENGYSIRSIPFGSSQPSINEPYEVDLVWDYVQKNKEQKNLLKQVLNFNFS